MIVTSGDSIDLLVETQIAPWRGYSFDRPGFEDRLTSMSNNHFGIFIFTIDGQIVSIRANPGISALISSGASHEVYRRALIFQDFIQSAVNSTPFEGRFVFAVNVIDQAESSDMPVFSFQKKIGDTNILLPDCELIEHHFMERYIDSIPFEAKDDKAFFLGSTTGLPSFTRDDVEAGRVARIRAARAFRSSSEVDFRLTNIVQHADDSVRDALIAEGFGGERAPLLGSYAYKFGISIDGNGAACSRPAIILNSKSALLKYKSSYILYYSSAMKDGIHFIDVNNEEDVISIVRHERSNKGFYAHIAEGGEIFARSYLTRAAATEYTSKLLLEYRKLVGE